MGKLWLKIKSVLTMAPMVILISEGRAEKIRGNISDSLINDFSELARATDIDQGLITISDDGDGHMLGFSGHFDEVAQQRFRNIWFAQAKL